MRTGIADHTVVTERGPVRGTVAGGLRITLGIPYADPPFGAGRFLAPRSATAWDEARDCTRYGPVAPQSAELPGSPAWNPDHEGVLTLNVWAPLERSAPLPVLFWIHGGAYTFGSSAQPDHDGSALAHAGTVVVTCNYRLGFEGFGHVPGFPDNRGLLDQIAALEWVRDNIAAFGGDPDNARYAGDPSAGFLHYDTVLYGPVIDGVLLDRDPLDTQAVGGHVDLLVCHTTEEYWLMHRVGAMPTVTTDDGLARFAADYGLPRGLVDAYRALMPGAPVLDVYLALAGDAVFTVPTARLAEAHACAGGGRTFLSRFDRRRPGPDGSPVRAWHAADVPFALGTLDATCVEFLTGGPADADDHALSRRMVEAWAAFAATGDPGWAPTADPADPTTPTVHVWGVPEDRTEGPGTAHALWRDVRMAPPSIL